jgi:acetoin utilization protein AcuB
MLIRDIMTTNVVTIPSNTSIADAKRIMEAHRFQRLPIVDKGKLVGIVTSRRLESVSPSKATSLTVWEMTYVLSHTPVKEIMEKNVITVTPETTAEEAVSLAQSNKVGTLVVLEDNHVVGIVTTNDFFYKIVNPILGLGSRGTRLEVIGASNAKDLEKIMSEVNKLGLEIMTLHIEALPDKEERNICLHVDSDDVSKLVAKLKSDGYQVNIRKR